MADGRISDSHQGRRPPFYIYLTSKMNIKNAIFLSSLLLTACSNSNDEPTEGGNFTFTVTPTESASFPVADGEKLGLYFFEGESKSLIVDNLCLIHDGQGNLYSENTASYPAYRSGLYIVAIAPYNVDWTHPDNAVREFSVKTDQRLYDNFLSSDLRQGVPVGGNPVSSTQVNLAFSHLYSRIDIEILDANSLYGLDDGNARLLNVITCGMVEPYSGFIVDRPDTEKFSVLPYETVHTARRLFASVIVPPQTFTAGADLLQLTCQNKEMTCGLPETTTLNSGETLSLQVNLTSSGLDVASTSVQDWKVGEDINIVIQK
jgi:hypothetical protein